MLNPSGPRVRRLLLGFGVIAAIEFWKYFHQDGPIESDFFGIWSWSRFVASEGAAALYDPAAIYRFQLALDPLSPDQHYPFLYPPTYLLFIWPLAHLSLGAARVVWSVSTLAAYLFALCGRGWRPKLVIAALVAPATVLCLICGQNGLLTAALLIGGLRCARSRPLLAGVLLGLLTYKPHLAVLVPVALIAARLWTALFAAASTAIVCVAASSLAFGVDCWTAWLAAQKASWATIDAFITAHLNMIPTVTAALRQLGFNAGSVMAGQIVATIAAACAIWMVWRKHRGMKPILVVPIAALVATPYAFIYDLPMLTGAALLGLADGSPRDRTALELACLGFALLLPQLMFNLQDAPLPLAAPLLLLMLIWLILPNTGNLAQRAVA